MNRTGWSRDAPQGEELRLTASEGRLVTEVFGYGGGRAVTVYVPGESADSVVLLADGGWHVSALSEALERSGRRSTLLVGVHGLPDDEGRLHEYVLGFDTSGRGTAGFHRISVTVRDGDDLRVQARQGYRGTAPAH